MPRDAHDPVRLRFDVEVIGNRHVDLDPEELEVLRVNELAKLLEEEMELRLVPKLEDLAQVLERLCSRRD